MHYSSKRGLAFVIVLWTTALGCAARTDTVAERAAVSNATLDVLIGGGCRTRADCGVFERCLAPGQSPGCGTCYVSESPCSSDAECVDFGAEYICAQRDCACDASCVPGCTSDTQCGGAEVCEVDHRCAGRPCVTDADCPANFACDIADTGRCGRKACTSDGDCAGFCVTGRCHEELGMCAGWPV